MMPPLRLGEEGDIGDWVVAPEELLLPRYIEDVSEDRELAVDATPVDLPPQCVFLLDRAEVVLGPLPLIRFN